MRSEPETVPMILYKRSANSSITGLTKSIPSSDHNRGLDPAESPINTSRLLASNRIVALIG